MDRAAPGGIPDEEYLADPANFAAFVRSEVKGLVPKKAADYLRRPDVVGRWAGVLETIQSNVEAQLVRGSDRSDGWRGAAETFLGHVRRRLTEAEQVAAAEEDLPSGPQGACEPDEAFRLLTVVRRYLVEESDLAEADRKPRREQAIEAVSEAMGLRPARREAR